MNPYVAVGVGQGLEDARRRMREEHMQDEDRAERKSELEYRRGRRTVEDTREDVTYADERADRPLRRKALETQVEGSGVALEGAKTSLESAKVSVAGAKQEQEWRTEDRPMQVEAEKVGLASAKDTLQANRTTRGRESELHDIKIKKLRQQLQDEGLDRFLDSIEAGGNTDQAIETFNAQGKNGIRLGSVRYDKATGAISFVGKDGHEYNGTTKELRAALPEVVSDKPINVPSGGSLYDTKTKKWMQPPGAAGAGGSGLTKFNPQVHGKQTRDLVIQGLGGEWDNSMQKFKVPAGMGEKISYGTSLADSVIRMSEEEGMRLGPGQVSDVVSTVMRNVRTTGEAMKMAKGELTNSDDASIQVRAQKIVDDSKMAAAKALKNEMDILRSNYQQQQTAQSRPPMTSAAGPAPAAAGAGAGEAMEPPPPEELREGYVQRYDDGTAWTLQDGRPVQVDE